MKLWLLAAASPLRHLLRKSLTQSRMIRLQKAQIISSTQTLENFTILISAQPWGNNMSSIFFGIIDSFPPLIMISSVDIWKRRKQSIISSHSPEKLPIRMSSALLQDFQRFQNTNQCSAGIGAAPQQAENPHFHFRRNEGGWRPWPRKHCLPVLSPVSFLLLKYKYLFVFTNWKWCLYVIYCV